jgi:hypothetical protein
MQVVGGFVHGIAVRPPVVQLDGMQHLGHGGHYLVHSVSALRALNALSALYALNASLIASF